VSQTKAQLLDGSVVSVSFGAGSAAAPSINYSANSTTGIYFPGSGQLAISTNGTQRLTVDTAATTSTLPVVHPLGAVGTPSITFTGDLNTGIYSPGADQVGISTGGSNRFFVDAAGRVGINKTPGAGAGLNQRLQIKQTGDTYDGLQIEKFDDDSFLGVGVFGSVWTFVASYNTTGSNLPVRFFVGNSERLRIRADGLVGIGTAASNANGGILQLSSGITFPATAVAASDANTLDDYEEGTWTPSLGGTATYTTNQATYTKIGRTVYVTAYIAVNSIGTGSTTTITGLPFSTAVTSNWVNPARVAGSVTNVVSINWIASGTSATLRSRTAAAADDATNAIFQGSTLVELNGFYFV